MTDDTEDENQLLSSSSSPQYSGEVHTLRDNSLADIPKYERAVRVAISEITDGNVQYICFKPKIRETRFILSRNSLQYERLLVEKIPEKLGKLYSVEHSDYEGEEHNERSLSGKTTGLPTMVIVRRARYKPLTSTWCMSFRIAGVGVFILLCAYILYWAIMLPPKA